MVLHWTGDRNRRSGDDAAADIIRQAQKIDDKAPRVVLFRPARFLGDDQTNLDDEKPGENRTVDEDQNLADQNLADQNLAEKKPAPVE